MITYRDFLADEYRRQDQMARAEQHRLLRSVLKKDARETSRLQRTLDWAGKMLAVLGQRMQTPNAGHEPTVLSR